MKSEIEQLEKQHFELTGNYVTIDGVKYWHEKTVQKFVQAVKDTATGQLPNSLILYRQSKKLDYAKFAKWINSKVGNLR